jgi:hypothetical protein
MNTRFHRRSTLTALAAALGLALLAPAVAAPSAASASKPFAATLEAHGGLERFAQQRSLGYTLEGFPLSPAMARANRSRIDLQTRSNRIDGDGFTVGFDGKQAWAVPDLATVGLPARFVTLGSFYFIGMPFVFGDDGVRVTADGDGTFRGETYRVYRVSYRRGTGYTSKDDYTLFVDPADDRLALIHHSVTENPDVDRVTWVFEEWQTVDGLVVPARMTFHPGWNPEDSGPGHSFTIEDVRFSLESPDPSLYAPPAGAEIEDSPSAE